MAASFSEAAIFLELSHAIPAREVVVLCELHELDYESAASILECPVGTVRSRLHRARALLVTKLAAMQQTLVGESRG